MIELLSPSNGARVAVTTDLQREFVRRLRAGEMDGNAHEYDWLPKFDRNGVDPSRPAPVTLEWICDGDAEVELFRNGAPAAAEIGPVICRCENGRRVCSSEVSNLMTGTKYEWRVRSKNAVSETRELVTDRGVRFVALDGISNVRDIGGYPLPGGKRVKQGMIFRGTCPLGNFEQTALTEKGRSTFTGVLGIRTEIDLRAEVVGTDEAMPADPSVEYHVMPIDPYETALGEKSREKLAEVFHILCDGSKYPVYVHCGAGADRTATVAFIAETLLGMDTDDVKLDYNLTTLSFIAVRSWDENELIPRFFDAVAKETGITDRQSSIRSLLLSLGVSEAELEQFRSIMIE